MKCKHCWRVIDKKYNAIIELCVLCLAKNTWRTMKEDKRKVMEPKSVCLLIGHRMRIQENKERRCVRCKKHVVKEKTFCQRYGHEFRHYLKENEYLSIDGKERCVQCGWVIASRKRMIEKQYEIHERMIGIRLNSEHYFEKIKKYYYRMKFRRFEETHLVPKIANTLYYLRYERGWSVRRIEKTLDMPAPTLNRYIYLFPWDTSMKKIS